MSLLDVTSQFDPLTIGFATNRKATFARLRDSPGIPYTPAYGGFWIITRPADVMRVLSDPRFLSGRIEFRKNVWFGGSSIQKAFGTSQGSFPMEADGALHGQTRKVIAQFLRSAYAQSVIEQLPEMYGTKYEDGVVDLARDWLTPVTTRAIRLLLGGADWPADAIWDSEFLLGQIRTTSGPGLVYDIAQSALSETDSIAMLNGFIGAAVDTTVSYCALSIIEATNVPTRTELLACISPVLHLARTAAEPITISGTTIPALGRVYVSLCAALEAGAPASLAFGHGVHTCVGRSLATEICRIVLSVVKYSPQNLLAVTYERGPLLGFHSLVANASPA